MTDERSRFFPLQRKLLLIFIPILTLSLFLSGMLVSRRYRTVLAQNEQELADRLINRIAGSVEQYTDEISSLANSIIYNASIDELIDKYQSTQFIGLSAQASFMQKLYGPFWRTSKGISYFHIGSLDGTNIISAGSMYKNENVRDQAFLDRQKQSEWIRHNGVETFGVTSATTDVISYFCRIVDVDSLQPKGVLCFDIPIQKLEDLIYGPDWIEDVRIEITNDEQAVLWQSSQESSDNYLQITVHPLESARLTVTGYLPEFTGSGLTKSLDTYRWIVLALCCLFSIAFAVTMSSFIFRPLRKLLFRMEKVKQGDLSERISFRFHDEISQLGDTFNEMMDSINKLMDQKITAEHSKREMEMKFLQTQINPHFLYNTLDTIRWQARRDNNPIVETQIKALSNMFRQYLQLDSEYILLSDEHAYLNDYMMLMKYRFGNDISFNFDDTTLPQPCYILKMLIQPLLENALVHGFSDMTTDCEIVITCILNNQCLEISVKDNGRGLACPDPLTFPSGGRKNYGKGFALSNLQNRIKTYYGEQYNIRILSEKGKGTTVILTLPYITHLDKTERLEK